MRRHVIAGTFGADDHIKISLGEGEFLTYLNLITKHDCLQHGIGDVLSFLTKIGIYPLEVGLDILILAAHVHAADTRISRQTESQDNWTREIRLVVPVCKLIKWIAAKPTLEKLLNFLTGDLWIVDFRERPTKFQTLVPKRTPKLFGPSFNSLSLFSGGLDSLIGAIDELEDGRMPLLISHAGDGAASIAQANLFNKLTAAFRGVTISRLRLAMGFPEKFILEAGTEETTRGRSFLFFALGVFAGTGMETPFTLRVPENGLISLNVPLDPLRLGALSTRTTHPFYMARWNQLLGILEIPGTVQNPYWDMTKGEMVKNCLNQNVLKELIPLSMSCSSPSKGRWEGHSTQHCGYCLPCLIRRAAIEHGLGKNNDSTTYTVADFTDHPMNTLEAEGKQIRSIQYASTRLLAHPELARILIHKPGPLSDESPERQITLANVYQRGIVEVAMFLKNVKAYPK